MSRHASHTTAYAPLSPGQRVRVTWDHTGREGTVLYQQRAEIYRVQVDGVTREDGEPMPAAIHARYLQPIETTCPAYAGEGI